YPVRDENGDIVGIVEVVEEITERKRAEEAIQESEARSRLILQTMPSGLFTVDLNRKITSWNKEAEEITGLKGEEVVGRDCIEALDCDECKKGCSLFDDKVDKPIYEKECTLHVGGRNITISKNADMLRDWQDNTIGGLESFVDISERKRTEEAIVRAKEDWENTFDAITDMVMLLDNEHRIIRVNRNTARVLNTTKESLVGKKCYEAVHGQKQPIVQCPLVLTMKTLNPQTKEITEPKLGGTFICSTSPLLNRDGKLVGYTHSLKDITEPKLLEAQLQQAQRMESIGTLAGGVAHDFNNILMGIQGFASLILKDLDETQPQYNWVRRIEDQVKSGAELTRQLLGFARGGKYDVKPININELVRKTSSLFGRTKKEITIKEEYEQDIWTVEVDQGQIKQVLLNLYVNAWQAMPAGGELYLETSNVTLDESFVKPYGLQPGRYVKISVTDTGIGIDDAIQQRIFDPFFTTKQLGWGTGLGLASAYGIVINHDGIINVYSKKGHGSTFNTYLPAAKSAVPSAEPVARDEQIKRGTETILLVDDEQTVLDVGKELLSELGYTVLEAIGGREAVEIYKENKDKIDMVLLDMVMPRMGGGEVYDRMKKINPSIKVLLSSGYSMNDQTIEILERGCDGFIQKPFNIHELSIKIREILDKE
ncbi:MAG: PAS domain S-box protein, partial [Desulfobacterales bacterium]|nr:PAS domain S-box protein [Desulfobacterales bacterium]